VLVLRANEPKLHIYSAELQSHTERFLHPNAHDLVWSRALDAALVLTGGDNDLQAKIEVFPAHPMGIQGSTAQLLDLITWTRPKHLAVSGNGSRLAISYASTRKLNVLVYDPRMRRTVSALVVSGEPEGLTFSADGMQLWTVSPEAENLTELGSLGIARSVFPKLASTSPPRMVAVNEHTRRAYTTGSLTFPEIDLNQHRITRTVELPERSAGIVLSPDKSTAYLTFEKLDIVGVVDLQAMRWIREIQLR
jgi:DNA-binding beta-propeller fold protein YncE